MVLFGNLPLALFLNCLRHLQLSSEVVVAYSLICGGCLNILSSLRLLSNYFYSPDKIKGNLRSIFHQIFIATCDRVSFYGAEGEFNNKVTMKDNYSDYTQARYSM